MSTLLIILALAMLAAYLTSSSKAVYVNDGKRVLGFVYNLIVKLVKYIKTRLL